MKKILLFTVLLLTSATMFAQHSTQSREKKVLTIKYLYAADLSQALPDSTFKFDEGEHYSIVSPELTGYTPDKAKIEGNMPDHDVTDTIRYTAKQYRVTTKAEPTDGGTTGGDGSYDYNTSVKVTASANNGFTFVKWTKGDEQVSTSAEYTFNITGDITLTAHFNAQSAETYTITATAEPAEGGSVSGAGSYDEGSTCSLTATANEGYSFVNWTEDGTQVSNEANYRFTVNANRTLVAHFEQQTPTHTISINPLILHGTISVSPEGNVEVGTQVTITATPETNYILESLAVYNKDDISQTVEINDNKFVMPDFDVLISATFALNLPIIEGDIATPPAICAGESLELTLPTVQNADEMTWQMAPNAEFVDPSVYYGQALDGSYNGWKLRLMASNSSAEVYSNVVNIVVNDLSNLTIDGESVICSGQETQYEIVGTGNYNLEWTTTDANANITPSGNTAKIKWGTTGNMTIKVNIEEQQSGCSTELEMTVKVQSYINNADVQGIVAKKHDGKPYMLIYPNPKDDYKYQWYKDGEAINGANGQYYYPTEGLTAGNYQVYISFNADAQGNLFCGAFSEIFTVSDAAFAIYPNPASTNEQIIVLTDSESEAVIAIYNMEGQLVHQQMSQGHETIVNAQLAQGVYVIRLINGNTEKAERIIIK